MTVFSHSLGVKSVTGMPQSFPAATAVPASTRQTQAAMSAALTGRTGLLRGVS